MNSWDDPWKLLERVAELVKDTGILCIGRDSLLYSDICNALKKRATAEPPALQWNIDSIERIARQQGVFDGRDGNTVTITGPIVIEGPHPYDTHTIPSPSAICGLIGCTNQQVHVHDVREPVTAGGCIHCGGEHE